MANCVCTFKGVQLKPDTLESDQLQHDPCGVCVIAQQYSSATFASLRFQFCKEKLGAHFKNFISKF
jgi:hypothetical protein